MLGIVSAWAIIIEVHKTLKNGKDENKKADEYVTNEKHNSAWLVPRSFLESETTGKERILVMYGKDRFVVDICREEYKRFCLIKRQF
jgi:hypothetical protein